MLAGLLSHMGCFFICQAEVLHCIGSKVKLITQRFRIISLSILFIILRQSIKPKVPSLSILLQARLLNLTTGKGEENMLPGHFMSCGMLFRCQAEVLHCIGSNVNLITLSFYRIFLVHTLHYFATIYKI
jgi:hypothetical protein